MVGLVVNKQKSSFIVEFKGELFVCKASGNLIKSGGHIFVGDHVKFEPENNLVTRLLPRHNFLLRPPLANVDLVLIVMSLVEPTFSSLLVEKFLSYVNFAEAKPLVIITKLDLSDETTLAPHLSRLDKLGVPYFIVNNVTGEGVKAVKKYIGGKITALMGQSGVGKSSFINALTDYEREIGKYNINVNRGRHVTKEVIMLPFNEGYIIDTPGFSSFELPLTKGDLAENYPGFKEYIGACRFNDCYHINEPGCAVKVDVEAGLISEQTYRNYVTISEELKRHAEDY
ncbi:MAG TPA: ribosome small subunit-dependent GTPase A [Bacilli bacterium]|nr:ribosome small subunit-dependent GTPase A [Bacilli bacterium]